MPFPIRSATAHDISAMAALRAEEWGNQAYWEERIAGYLAGTTHPQQALGERAAFVAGHEDGIVGFVAGHRTRRFGCEGEIEWINVAATERGQGVAGLLLARMAGWFVEQRTLRVCVNVTDENLPARRLYERWGAQPYRPGWMVWQDIGEAAAAGDEVAGKV